MPICDLLIYEFLMWRDVLDPVTGKLLFKYDPVHDLVFIKRGRIRTIVSLRRFRPRRQPGEALNTASPISGSSFLDAEEC